MAIRVHVHLTLPPVTLLPVLLPMPLPIHRDAMSADRSHSLSQLQRICMRVECDWLVAKALRAGINLSTSVTTQVMHTVLHGIDANDDQVYTVWAHACPTPDCYRHTHRHTHLISHPFFRLSYSGSCALVLRRQCLQKPSRAACCSASVPLNTP